MEGPSKGQWPSRLLAVGKSNSTDVRLCETSAFVSSQLQYATLSHCWGDFVPLRLLNTNKSSFFNAVPDNLLPRTFRDAVEVTRNLGLRYLWIDSLCIIQDCAEDWAAESNRMYEIYRHSYINLAAVASTDATGGLVHWSSLLSRIPCQMVAGRGEFEEQATTMYTPGTKRDQGDLPLDLPLLRRAWVLQEILLSTRVLFFTRDEVCWECSQMNRTETYPAGKPASDGSADITIDDGVIPFRKAWRETARSSYESRFELWNKVITRYSGMKLSKHSDKLVAVAGLATDLGRTWPEMDYLAGLWSYDLHHGLLWYASSKCTRSRFYNAPSWSWASVEGKIAIGPPGEEIFRDTLVEIVEACTVTNSPARKYGSVTDGYVRLKGPLLRAQIIRGAGSDSQTMGYYHTIQLLEDSAANECEGLFNFKMKARILWDDSGLGEIWQVAKTFLIPFEISTRMIFGATVLTLCGIILSPTSQKGQYQRIGFFEIRDLPSGPSNNNNNSQISTRNSSSQGSPVESSGLSEMEWTRTTDETHPSTTADGFLNRNLITIFEVKQVFNEYEEEREKLSKLPKIIPLSKRPLRNTVSDSSSRGQPATHDKYCNGAIDLTVAHRYENQLEYEDYPNIDSFLTFITIHFEIFVCPNPEYWSKFYEECHGGGIFTIRIV